MERDEEESQHLPFVTGFTHFPLVGLDLEIKLKELIQLLKTSHND